MTLTTLAGTIILCLIAAGYHTRLNTWADTARLALALVLIPTSIFLIFSTMNFWESSRIGEIPATVHQLKIIPRLLFLCCLVPAIIPSFATYKKRGFSHLNTIKEDGVIKGLVNGLTIGSIGGLFICFIGGLIGTSIILLTRDSFAGLFYELTIASTVTLTSVLAAWLIVGSIIGSATGYKKEFKN